MKHQQLDRGDRRRFDAAVIVRRPRLGCHPLEPGGE